MYQERDYLGGQLLKRIPDLVDKAIFGRAARAKQASQALIERTSNSISFDPVLVAVDAIQRKLLSGYDASALNNANGLLSDMIHQAGSNPPEGRGTKIINLTPEIVDIVGRIARNGQRLQLDPKLVSVLPNNYKNLVSDIPPFVKAGLESGSKTVELTFARPVREGEDLQKRAADRQRWNQWMSSFTAISQGKDDQLDEEHLDRYIDLIKEEPDQDTFREKKLFTAQYAGLSLADIEQLPDLLSEEDYAKVTGYLLGFFSDRPSSLRVEAIDTLFFKSKFFAGPTGLIVYKNAEVLAHLNSWQEKFVQRIMVQKDQASDDQLRRLLGTLPETSRVLLLASLYLWTTHPHELDPTFTGDYQTRPYFIYDQAIAEYRRSHPDEIIPSAYGDEIAIDYFKAKVFPNLEKRLQLLGVEDNFRSPMQFLKRMLDENSYEQEHLRAVKDVFEKHCGEEFLQKLQERSSEIEEVTENVLKSVFDENMHFLPMQQGINIIHFSQDSVPDILGLKSLSFNRTGDITDWQLQLVYSFRDTYFKLLGFLSPDGKLRFKAPIEVEMPGLYTILRHIAVLTFRDLVVQDKMEQQDKNVGLKVDSDITQLTQPPKDVATRNLEMPYSISQGGILPREQSDRELIGYLYHKTGLTPRVVEIHLARLPGAKLYLRCVQDYQYVLGNNLPESEILEIEEKLKKARKQAYTTSEIKKKTVPVRFKLATISDPITEEERYLETWVIEHTVPKPTDEELKSPSKLYARYYSRSSSLAFLEQLKPWFVGL